MAKTSFEEKPCPRCQGTGTCRECGGSGQQTCLACEGKGQRATSRGVTYACKTCGGSGHETCSPTCLSCGGSGVITEKMQQEVREKYRPRFVDYSPLSHVSSVLLIVNVAVYILTDATGPQGRAVFNMLTNTPYVLVSHEYWRFVTPMFLHGGLVHLAFNGIFLLQFCPQMEGMYGSRAFLALYLFSGLLGDVFSWFGHAGWAGVGASGALFGVGTAYIGLHKRFGLFDAAAIRGWTIYLVGFLVIGFLTGGSTPMMGARIDNWGHLGGAVGGLLFTWIMPRPAGRS